MIYSTKFQQLADAARSRIKEVAPEEVDALMASGAIALDIRDPEEHAADHIANSLHVSRGKLEMNIEGVIPDLDATILCYCNAINRGALSTDTLRAMGYRNAKLITGGLRAYRALA
jgi:phage shock protein E